MSSKVTKQTAKYVDDAPRHQCQTCTMFETPHGCSTVEGKIDPRGHCKYYAPAHKLKSIIK